MSLRNCMFAATVAVAFLLGCVCGPMFMNMAGVEMVDATRPSGALRHLDSQGLGKQEMLGGLQLPVIASPPRSEQLPVTDAPVAERSAEAKSSKEESRRARRSADEKDTEDSCRRHGFTPGQVARAGNLEKDLQEAIGHDSTMTLVCTKNKPHWLHAVQTNGVDHPTMGVRNEKMWECPLTVLGRWAFEEGCSEGDSVAVDVGMNIGWFTLLAAALGRRVLAFEPNDKPLYYARKSIEANGWEDRVKLYHGGVSQDGADLRVPDTQYWGTASASKSGPGKSVPSFILDNVLDHKTSACFFKADCQGCEEEAFKSAKKYFGEDKVEVVQLEFYHNDKAAAGALQAIFDLSPTTWHCVALPVGLGCDGGKKAMWEFVAIGVIEDCRPDKVDGLSKHPPPAYYTDLWIMKEHVLRRLRQYKDFEAAAGRVARAQSLKCSYVTTQKAPLGVCDMFCQRFPNLQSAQDTCSRRPTCKQIIRWGSFYELRGISFNSGSSNIDAWMKGDCS
eukprot:TRINITY_DN27416_c0_g1_i3.p1 TRINITY_DN27416_c0_g1~~TRINITY_DN27416_c0_g1_i3.p1  ORF type:complete len:504 (-),score=145.33 TRINITY_DN27416_c0_g1_i3:550-2061(-)